MPDINTIMPPILAILGVSLFLSLPLRVRWTIRKYAPERYNSRLFYIQCLLSLMPLLEWVLFLIWTQSGMRAAIIGAITFCFVFYFLLVMRGTQIIQEISLEHNNSIKELKNILSICYTMRSFYILIALFNILFGMDFLGWTPPLGSAARQGLVSLFFLFTFVLNMVIMWIESQLVSRRQKRLELAHAQSPDEQQI